MQPPPRPRPVSPIGMVPSYNPFQVHLDITRPGAPPTQPELVRLTGQERAVNSFLTEAASRLTLN